MKAKPKPKIIFTAPRITTGFMTDDIALLERFSQVIPLDLSECHGFQRYTYLTQLADLLIRQGAEIVFCYFVMAKYTPPVALLTKMLGGKLVIASGGIDATYVPDIHWGDLGSPLRRSLFALVMRLADSVLAFSDSSRYEIIKVGHPKRVRTAYPAIDAAGFVPSNGVRRRQAVTVCHFISRGEWIQKGIRDFVQAARFAPEVEFVAHGELDEAVRAEWVAGAPSNVRFTENRLDRTEYIALLQGASVYVQASAHEGFGVALAEAMACGCVPVVSSRYALPETVGDTGYIVPFGDPVALAGAVRQALAHPEKGLAARQRVIDNFSVAQRARILQEECEFVLERTLNASDIDS